MYYFLLALVPLFAFATMEGATVLITGANRGLGLEFAKQYREKGFTVIGTARNPEEAKELEALDVRVEELDVADGKSVKELAKKLDGVPIDILINNAGIFRGRSDNLKNLDMDHMDISFAVNSTGPLRVTQALLPNLKAGKLKKIVNITSGLGSIEQSGGGMYPYRASKAALNQISKSLSIELEDEGFTVIAIHPGWVQTDMGGESATFTPEQSINRMIDVIDKPNRRTNGKFLDLNGNRIPW